MIKILITGGTIDKSYDPISQALVFKNTCVFEIIQKMKLKDVSAEILMLTDSRDMNDDHFSFILKSVHKESSKMRRVLGDGIVITCGTDRMVDLAKFLSKEVKSDIPITLTGALIPYSVDPVEASFNLSDAIRSTKTRANINLHIRCNNEIGINIGGTRFAGEQLNYLAKDKNGEFKLSPSYYDEN